MDIKGTAFDRQIVNEAKHEIRRHKEQIKYLRKRIKKLEEGLAPIVETPKQRAIRLIREGNAEEAIKALQEYGL
jgi:uncharacterized membrane protein